MFKQAMARLVLLSVGTIAFIVALGLTVPAYAQGAPTLKIVSPKPGETITSTDIPVTVEVSNFTLSALKVGLPDQAGEGHIHVMIDGAHMGVLFNFYTSTTFTLPGDAIKPGPHALIFDLASNTHVDMPETAVQVDINYQPATSKSAPQAVANPGAPAVEIVSPTDGATVGPIVTLQVKPTNFVPREGLEGKANISGYGHYHVFVDADLSMMMPADNKTPEANATPEAGGGMAMMSMAGMVLMPGANEFSVDLSAWGPGKHTIVVEPVQNDHTPIEGGKHAQVTINLQSSAPAAQATTAPAEPTVAPTAEPTKAPVLPTTGGDFTNNSLLLLLSGALILGLGLVLVVQARRRA
ncbi:MAG: hypothetical protein HY741_01375 [Chloroflexi bacterium]|nr:hypothetical protein [Chloroflexota bacterium]